jgi:hypothetical protein
VQAIPMVRYLFESSRLYLSAGAGLGRMFLDKDGGGEEIRYHFRDVAWR